MKYLILALLSFALNNLPAQDYSDYNALLSKYVAEGGVNYQAWSKSKEDVTALNNILTEWAKVDSSKLSTNDQAAFRINLYNAAMLDVVLDHYPLKSVTKLGKPFSIFDKKLIVTPKGKISLNTLEKKILLKDFPDSRVHFAINCASISCPPLNSEAFTGKTLDVQLTHQATQFANSKHAVKIKGNSAKYSELFNWYAKDFKTTNPAQYLNKFRTQKIANNLSKGWIKYNWNLNSTK